MKQKTEDRGPGARKVEIEKRLDNNADLERRASEVGKTVERRQGPGKSRDERGRR